MLCHKCKVVVDLRKNSCCNAVANGEPNEHKHKHNNMFALSLQSSALPLFDLRAAGMKQTFLVSVLTFKKTCDMS